MAEINYRKASKDLYAAWIIYKRLNPCENRLSVRDFTAGWNAAKANTERKAIGDFIVTIPHRQKKYIFAFDAFDYRRFCKHNKLDPIFDAHFMHDPRMFQSLGELSPADYMITNMARKREDYLQGLSIINERIARWRQEVSV